MKLVDKGTCTITFCYFYGKKKNLILKISSYLKKKTKYIFFYVQFKIIHLLFQKMMYNINFRYRLKF